MVDARLEVEKLEEYFNIELPEGEFESVGGLIIHILGKIPKPSEKVSYKNLEMTIKSADDRRINKVLITHGSPSDRLSTEDKKH